MTDTALVTREQNSLTIPEHLKGSVGGRLGRENVEKDDVLIPRLSVAQEGMSPQMKKKNENYNPDLEDGDIFDSLSGEIYGKEVTVIPLFFFKNFIKFRPQAEGGGVLAQYSSKSEVPMKELAWVDGVKPATTEFKNRMCIINSKNGIKPIVVSFKSSGIKCAKKWEYLIGETNMDAFARAYHLRSITMTRGEQSWNGLDVRAGDFVPAEFYKAAKDYFTQLQEGGFKVDTSGLEGAEENQDAEAPGF